MVVVCLQIFKVEKCLKKKHHASVYNNNARFCYQSKEKYYPQTLLEECKYEQENIKMEDLIDDDLEKSESEESDSDSNNETEYDDESNE